MSKIIPKDKEYFFEDNVIISQTDVKGIVTYGNRIFFNISGYKKDELIGKPYTILRHPDMPKEVFKKMWEVLQAGQSWNGLIKNLRKDGLYYWVNEEILPVKDENNKIIGYIAVQKAASKKDIQENEKIYQKMLETQK